MDLVIIQFLHRLRFLHQRIQFGYADGFGAIFAFTHVCDMMLLVQSDQIDLSIAPIFPIFRCDITFTQIPLQLLSAHTLKNESYMSIDEVIPKVLDSRIVLHPDYGIPIRVYETEPEGKEIVRYDILTIATLLWSLLGYGYHSLQHPDLDELLQIRQYLLRWRLNRTSDLLHCTMPICYGLEIGVVT